MMCKLDAVFLAVFVMFQSNVCATVLKGDHSGPSSPVSVVESNGESEATTAFDRALQGKGQVAKNLQHNLAGGNQQTASDAAHGLAGNNGRLVGAGNAATAASTAHSTAPVPSPAATPAASPAANSTTPTPAPTPSSSASAGVDDACYGAWSEWNDGECAGKTCGAGLLRKRYRDYKTGAAAEAAGCETGRSGSEYSEAPCRIQNLQTMQWMDFPHCENAQVKALKAAMSDVWGKHWTAHVNALKALLAAKAANDKIKSMTQVIMNEKINMFENIKKAKTEISQIVDISKAKMQEFAKNESSSSSVAQARLTN